MTGLSVKALFLDRDGVINYDSGYTSNKESFVFIDGIFDLCRAAIESGYVLFVVTNQAGIGRGYYTEQDFLNLSSWMCEQFVAQQCPIQEVFFCPYHPEHGTGVYKQESFHRKPNPGMLLDAAEKYSINLAESMMIGDKDSDMGAARNAGVNVRCHYIPGGRDEQPSPLATHIIHTLSQAISLLKQ